MARFDFAGLADSLAVNQGFHRASFGSVYGVIDGLPVHVAEGTDNNGAKFLMLVVATESQDAAEAIKRRWSQDDPDLKPRMIEVAPVGASAQIPAKRAGNLGTASSEELIFAMAATARPLAGISPPASSARPGLVNGFPRYLTEVDAAELSFEGDQMSSEYQELQPRIGRGILFGLGGVVISALVWGAIGAYLDFQAWIVAIGAGLLIGWLTLLGVGKTNRAVQSLIAVMTIAAVILGEITAVTLFLLKELDVFDPKLAVDIYGEIAREDTGSVLFPLAGALIGGWYGARLGKKPQIKPEIEIAPL